MNNHHSFIGDIFIYWFILSMLNVKKVFLFYIFAGNSSICLFFQIFTNLPYDDGFDYKPLIDPEEIIAFLHSYPHAILIYLRYLVGVLNIQVQNYLKTH